MVKIGDKIRITSDNENYDKFRKKLWVIEDIARSRREHPGYDEGVGGNLVSAEGLPVSLYDWEFKVVKTSSRKSNIPDFIDF